MIHIIFWLLFCFFAAIGIFISGCMALVFIGAKLGWIEWDWKTWSNK